MSRYLVDTDWIIDVLHGQAIATETLLKLTPDGLAVSLITYGELYEGALFSRNPQAALDALRAFLAGKDLLPLTPAIMERFALTRGRLLRHVRQQVGDVDLLIAATALHHGLTILTRILKHYQHIPDPEIYQPS